MTLRWRLGRILSVLGLSALIAAGTPLAARAASSPPASATPVAQAATYPPATTGTFEVTGHPGTNRVTINGLGENAEVTAIVSGRGPAPALGPISGTPTAHTVNLQAGKTDASGSVTFNLVFAQASSGVYNVSVSTPDGHSVSGSVTIPSPNTRALDWTGSNIALCAVILAGVFLMAGLVALLVAVVRRRAAS